MFNLHFYSFPFNRYTTTFRLLFSMSTNEYSPVQATIIIGIIALSVLFAYAYFDKRKKP